MSEEMGLPTKEKPMTLEEAQKIGDIIAKADGGCSVCVNDLCENLNEQFPEFTWVMCDWYTEHERIMVSRQ